MPVFFMFAFQILLSGCILSKSAPLRACICGISYPFLCIFIFEGAYCVLRRYIVFSECPSYYQRQNTFIKICVCLFNRRISQILLKEDEFILKCPDCVGFIKYFCLTQTLSNSFNCFIYFAYRFTLFVCLTFISLCFIHFKPGR